MTGGELGGLVVVVAAGLSPLLLLAEGRFRAARRRWRRREVWRARRVPIADLEHGQRAKVTGGIVAGRDPMMTAPIGDDECIGYRIVESVKDRDTDRVVMDKGACGAFILRDDTGKARVDGALLVEVEPREGFRWHLGTTERRGYQRLLKPGDRVTVFGRALLEADPDGTSMAVRSPPLMARCSGSKGDPVIIVDADDT